MGKGLESLGLIDGFDIIEIGKFKAKKDDLFSEIKKYDDDVITDVRNLVNTKSGAVFAIVKKKIIYGLYLFKIEKKNDNSSMKHIKTVYSDEVTKETRDKYDEHILSLVKELVSYQEFDKATLNDEVIQLDPKNKRRENVMAMIGGFVLGFLIGWIIFDKFYMGLCFGAMFAPAFSGLDVVVQKKRGRKKEK